MTPRKEKNLRQRVQVQHLPVLQPDAAGIDVGSAEHWVAVPPDRDAEPVRRFAAFTADLARLADWLAACGVQTVAMEATGVYWIPLFELLESRGFEVFLVDPRQTRTVKGRPKTDRLDCQWVRRLHACGLLAGSFRPPDQIVVLRGYLRQKQMLVRYAGQHIQQRRLARPVRAEHRDPVAALQVDDRSSNSGVPLKPFVSPVTVPEMSNVLVTGL